MIDDTTDSVAQITHDTGHVSEGLALFYHQFRNATKLQALAAAWLVQVQDVEDMLWALLACTLDNAVGAALDQFGSLLVFPRGGMSDDETYRAVLRSVVLAHRSDGRPEDLIAVARAALGNANFSLTLGSASVLLEPHAPIPFDATALYAVLELAVAGGVQLGLIVPPDVEANLFTFSTDPFRSIEGSALQGLADTAQTTGGELTGAM